jgi:hypothetical protein
MRAKRTKYERPIHDNLVRQLALAEEYLNNLYALEEEGCGCGLQITRTLAEVEKLRRLTN